MSQTFGAWRATYTPGSWVVLAGPSSLVVMQPAAPRHSGLVSSIWRQVAEAEDPESLVETLAAIGLAKMPSLGLFFWVDGQMYSMARGQVVVKDASTGEVVNCDDGLLTWSEKKLNPATVVVEMEQAEQRLSMPLLLGVAQASKLIIDATGNVEPFVVPEADEIHRPHLGSDDAAKPWTLAGHDADDVAEAGGEAESGEISDDEDHSLGFVEVPAPGEVTESSTEPTTDGGWESDGGDGVGADEPVSPVPARAAEPESVETAAAGDDIAPVRAQDEVGVDESRNESARGDGDIHTGVEPVGVQPESADVVAALAPGTAAGQPDMPRQFEQSDSRLRDWRVSSGSAISQLSTRSDAAVATLVSSTGEVTHLQRPVLIGRAPRGENGEDTMRVPSPGQDISRTHVMIAPGQWGIEVTDMHSTNGTVVHRGGQEPLRLESGQTIDLSIGDSVDLGDGVVITIEAYQG
ncbi:FHA domain-containing protein [Cutibacterium sp. WCA-380-WT-3A]|uniref:FHA domain-containing protein n=1 Tax=Cutibacterium porci TaxID=2605781 RepID=A0A7K0J943_9ACTN|nr:FHA domain-containing protein [Cutibacterium porci]MSS46278.1 FHA domain-containing protein [Cutibacterium porci]